MDESASDFESWYRRAHPVLVTALAVSTGDADMAADSVDGALGRALVADIEEIAP